MNEAIKKLVSDVKDNVVSDITKLYDYKEVDSVYSYKTHQQYTVDVYDRDLIKVAVVEIKTVFEDQ